MAAFNLTDIRQMLKVIDEAGTTAGMPDVVFIVPNATELKWWLDRVDPDWRSRQTIESTFGKRPARTG